MAEKPTTLVVAAIIAREDRLLINQRPAGGSLGGRWEFPGGKVEPGEDPRNALARECREELGCDVEVGSAYETVFHEAKGAWLLLLFYTARVVSGEPHPMEGNTLAWVRPDELGSYDLLEADRPLAGLLQRKFPHFEHGA
ncbi:MAG: (deoxy)nucleoside triphosphate pyrophosphohydrolase [Candidatus Sumerlaeia bacterium]|nr:(deoxy)nucleoside triphosphate pyrophosphohydrolase [Candidatus Sumerlaeia bacterium]